MRMMGRLAFAEFIVPQPAMKLDCKKREFEMALKVLYGVYST